MKDYCHDFPEYDPSVGKSSLPNKPEKILGAVGQTENDIHEKEQELKEAEFITGLFGTR